MSVLQVPLCWFRHLGSEWSLAVPDLQVVPALPVGVVLPHLQLEGGEPHPDHLAGRRNHRPLTVQFRLVAAVTVRVEAGDGAAAGGEIEETAAPLQGAVGEAGDCSEPAGSYGMVRPEGWVARAEGGVTYLNWRVSCLPVDLLTGGDTVWLPQYLPRHITGDQVTVAGGCNELDTHTQITDFLKGTLASVTQQV